MNTEERLKILAMVSEGKITVEEGARLLDTASGPDASDAQLDTFGAAEDLSPPAGSQTDQPVRKVNGGGKHLRIKVMERNGTRVNVNLPLSLMEVGLRIGGRFVDELKDMDAEMQLLMEAVQNEVIGKIVEVDDEDSHVEIYIE